MIRTMLSLGALALGIAIAPKAQAQTTSQLLVCRDGHVTSTARYGVRACDANGGIDQRATVQARQNATGNTRGVYNGTNGTNGSNRGVYNGTNGSNRGVYDGTINGTDRRIDRDRDDDDDRGNVNGRGKAKGHHKNKHKHKHDDRDRD